MKFSTIAAFFASFLCTAPCAAQQARDTVKTTYVTDGLGERGGRGPIEIEIFGQVGVLGSGNV